MTVAACFLAVLVRWLRALTEAVTSVVMMTRSLSTVFFGVLDDL